MKARSILFIASIAVGPSLVAQAIDWSRASAEANQLEEHEPTTERGATTAPSVQVAYDNYYVASLNHRRQVFAWQAFASRVIFWMVLGLVISGVAFSAIQFFFAIRRGTTEFSQELEVSAQAVKIRSQFLGVVTLALSLAFFYLYLTNVYPIVRIDTTNIATRVK
ncbi:MAG: hypothetical protein QOF63_1572 [Thermoanaerobaculia bacterium]|jgi:hypothetical protein|nr:hypothetical protein [Thermoanaerobaculia bacterium]